MFDVEVIGPWMAVITPIVVFIVWLVKVQLTANAANERSKENKKTVDTTASKIRVAHEDIRDLQTRLIGIEKTSGVSSERLARLEAKVDMVLKKMN